MLQKRHGVGGKKKTMGCEDTYNETSARKENRKREGRAHKVMTRERVSMWS